MIARFRVLLPFTLSLRQGDVIRPVGLSRGGYSLTLFPPYEARVKSAALAASSTTPLRQVLEDLLPAEPQGATETVLVSDAPSIPANALQIDVHKETFDRRRNISGPETNADPPIDLLFEVVNSLLVRLRSLVATSNVRAVARNQVFWRLDYLTDGGEPLPASPELIRRRMGGVGQWRLTALTADVWAQVLGLPDDYEPPVWQTLLLDAQALLPEVGPALVLAAGALETLIEGVLEILASRSGLAAGLWEWINDRGDYRKEPSMEERFDVLLRSLSGKSLKDERELWEAFKNLKDARNSFAHTGRAEVVGRATPVTLEMAYEYVGKAGQIAAWTDALLPPEHRLPRLERPPAIAATRVITEPATP